MKLQKNKKTLGAAWQISDKDERSTCEPTEYTSVAKDHHVVERLIIAAHDQCLETRFYQCYIINDATNPKCKICEKY